MQNLFYRLSDVDQAGATPTILAVGDSWFWYPIPNATTANMLEALAPSLATKGHSIFAVGNNGAESGDFVGGKYTQMFQTGVKLFGGGLSAVFLSAGGNDFAGFGDLRPLLRDDCSAQTQAKDCFRSGANGLSAFFDSVEANYRAMIGYLYTRTPRNCHVVMHTYDYAIPNGKGLFGGKGWLRDSLVDARVPSALHQDCIRLIVDMQFKRLSAIAKSDPDHLHVVDSRGVLSATQWANELHPNGRGFQRISQVSWQLILRNIALIA